MAKVVAFGELLLRLKPPGVERFLQSPLFEARFGGAEFNVLASLSRLGVGTSFVSAIPEHDLGDAACGAIAGHGVSVDHVIRQPGRMGLYYLEGGSGYRASKVIYDRAGSAFAETPPYAYDWSSLLKGADWFHVTGITPAISENAAISLLDAVKMASAMDVPVSFDLNYRRQLWDRRDVSPQSVLRPILDHVTVLGAGADDGEACLGVSTPPSTADRFEAFAERVLAEHENIKFVVSTFRDAANASQNVIWARAVSRTEKHTSRCMELSAIVDRIGAGDAFMAGLIYGMLQNHPPPKALDFAIAADAFKHNVPGDVNLASLSEIEALLEGDTGGRVRR